MFVQFTGSQESILQVDGLEDHIIENSNVSQPLTPRRGSISPLPEIRAVVITNQQVRTFKQVSYRNVGESIAYVGMAKKLIVYKYFEPLPASP